MAIWDSKKYNRINWKNRPSTATALGATNLNKVDVFCNEVDNALIQMDAGKLDIATANSMLASVTFDQDTGVFTFKELDGTTYTYDLNLEKIPVSFTLTEEGVLIMTTEDGTEWECNIADLIKDYVFDDSETIAFEKEFVGTDDEGKGSYHVSASVKAGSINETHLDPDYRADILTYKTQAQEAANDSLTYSKDSKRWAVGDAEYEGSATDNSKYYKEQAEAAKTAAEQARDEAQAATGAVIATTTQLGVVKPDGTTIGVEEDGTIKSIIKAASLLITDNQELVVEKQGEVAQETTTQVLIDAIADKVANQLVTNTALTSQLANYVTKAMMSNIQVNDQNKVPTSALAYAMNQAISALSSDLEGISDSLGIEVGNFVPDSEYMNQTDSYIYYENLKGNISIINFRWTLAKEVPSMQTTKVLQIAEASARDITHFVAMVPNGIGFPCQLDASGNFFILNYRDEAIPANYQLYGQVVFIKKQN